MDIRNTLSSCGRRFEPVTQITMYPTIPGRRYLTLLRRITHQCVFQNWKPDDKITVNVVQKNDFFKVSSNFEAEFFEWVMNK